MPDRSSDKPQADPAAEPFYQVRCADSRLLLAAGYRAALRACELAQASIDPSKDNQDDSEEEN